MFLPLSDDPSIDPLSLTTFVPGAILHAVELNDSFASVLPLSGGVLTRVDAPGTPSVPVLRINYTGAGSSNGALMVNVAATDGNAFPWGITSNVVVTQSGSGQPVGITSAVQRKSGNATSFCYYAEFRDLTGLSQQGTDVCIEQDLFANGPDGPSTYWAPGSGTRAAITLGVKNQDHPDWAPITNYNQGDVINPVLVYGPGDNPPVTGTGTTWSAYCYIAQNAGTSGSIAPAWPTTQGNTIVDGGVTWVCGTTYQGGFSRILSLGGSLGAPPINARRMPNVSTALVFGNMNIYNAVIDMSGPNLNVAAGINPNGDTAIAAIRLKPDWPIDFSGGNFNNQNQRTLKYNSTTNAFEYTLNGVAVFSIDDAIGGAVLITKVVAVGGGPPVASVQVDVAGSNAVGIRTSGGTFTGAAIRLGADQLLSFESGDAHYLQYRAATGRLYYVAGGVDMWSVDASGNMRAKGTLTGSTTP
jgi:hypothetical protein